METNQINTETLETLANTSKVELERTINKYFLSYELKQPIGAISDLLNTYFSAWSKEDNVPFYLTQHEEEVCSIVSNATELIKFLVNLGEDYEKARKYNPKFAK